MSLCYSSSPAEGEILCTKPCVDGMYNGMACPSSFEGTQTVTHNVHTNASATFGLHTIPFLKTDRVFSITSTGSGTPTSRSVTGGISELIDQTKCTLHYINSAEDVCLYKKTVTHLDFSGGDSGCVSSLHFWNSYAKIKISNLNRSIVHTYVLLRKGVEEILGTYIELQASGSGLWKMFLAPTPNMDALQYDVDIATYGFYNDYVSCPTASADSNVALDGGPDMFYPEWARDWTSDMMWQQVAVNKFFACNSGTSVVKDNFGVSISTEPIPIGDFARHPLLGDCYSWLLNLGVPVGHTTADYAVVNYNEGTLANTLLTKALEPHKINLKALTAYYPISII
jgi:hypothetical protein